MGRASCLAWAARPASKDMWSMINGMHICEYACNAYTYICIYIYMLCIYSERGRGTTRICVRQYFLKVYVYGQRPNRRTIVSQGLRQRPPLIITGGCLHYKFNLPAFWTSAICNCVYNVDINTEREREHMCVCVCAHTPHGPHCFLQFPRPWRHL